MKDMELARAVETLLIDIQLETLQMQEEK